MADVVHGPTNEWAATPPGRVARPISWGAILAGAVLVVVIQMMLGLLGLAIGLATVDPATEDQPFAGLGVGGFIWWLVSGIIALFIGGWAAARLAGSHRRTNGVLHGLVVWGLATLFMAWLLTTTAGAIMGGAFNLLERTVAHGTQAVTGIGGDAVADSERGRTANGRTADGRAANGRTTDGRTADGKTANGRTAEGEGARGQVTTQAQNTLQRMQAAAGAWDQLRPALDNYFDEDGATQQDKERVVEILVAQTNMSRSEAQQSADQWAQVAGTWQQTTERVTEVAEKVTEWSAAASFWAFLMLLIGAGAAAVGGGMGIWRVDRFGRDEPVTPPRA